MRHYESSTLRNNSQKRSMRKFILFTSRNSLQRPLPVFDPMPQTVPVDEDEQSKLNHWQDKIAQSGVKVTLHEPTGAVVEEVLNEADVVNADLIVLGTHGHGAMYNLLVGSVTKGVLRRSTRPVLLVPGPRR